MEEATITSTFVTEVGKLATQVTDGLIQILPAVLPILGTLILIAILIRVIQRVTGRRA